MKTLNRHAAILAAFTCCVGSLWAGPAAPAVVAPRLAPVAATPAARVEPQNMPNHHPFPSTKYVTTTKDGVPGSLRAVLDGASDGDSIKFSLHYPAVISLSNTLVISKSVKILGPGCGWLTVQRTTVSNTPLFRVFDIESGTVSILGITIQNGVAFDHSTYVDNVGGGIFNRGNLTVSDCIITANSAPTTTTNGTNSVGFGGGIYSDSTSTLTLINTTVSDNQATSGGGGIYTINTTLLVKGCTFSDNFAGAGGGGVGFQGNVGTIQNSTISSNSTPDFGSGSGLLTVAFDAQAAPSLTVTACTIAGNTGSTNGAVSMIALNNDLGMTNRFLSTVVADNTTPNFYFYGTLTFTSLGDNLDSDGTSGLSNGVNGDIVGTLASPINALLGPLQDNGGPTYTMALLVGSPAIGAGSCVDASGAPLFVDQRGFPRGNTNGCDIGAYEYSPLILTCPGPIQVDFQTAAGAVVKYKARVYDFCPYVNVTYTPPSGSLFPLGDTLVTVQATDGCSSNSQSCSFTVTVLAPQGVKSNVLEVLDELYSKANSGDKKKLAAAIADIIASLNPALWVDATHVDPQNGGQVFSNEQDAVAQLQKLSNSHSDWGHNHDDKGGNNDGASEQIDRLVKCDRLLASVSVADAISGGGDPAKIAQAKKEIMQGDASAAKGKPADAIQHYWNAWALTVNL